MRRLTRWIAPLSQDEWLSTFFYPGPGNARWSNLTVWYGVLVMPHQTHYKAPTDVVACREDCVGRCANCYTPPKPKPKQTWPWG